MGEYEFRAVTEAIHEEDRETFRMPRASAPSRMGWGLGRGKELLAWETAVTARGALVLLPVAASSARGWVGSVLI